MIESTSQVQQVNGDDLLWRQLKTIPAFRALLRSVEARFYQVIDFQDPILDLGCGDGHFAQVTFREEIAAGIDPWWGPLQKAQRSQMYRLPMQAMGDFLPFPDKTFASGFSNSVLEHIPDVQPVLNEVSRVMKPSAPFVLTVPSHYFTEFLGGADFFNNLGLEGAAGMYQNLFNRISRHAHTDPPEIWAERLGQAGFTIERWQYYFSKEALRTLELGHAQGIPSAILHALTGHWILGPWKSNLKWAEGWVRPYYEEEFPQEGAYLFFLARKTADGPLPSALPAAQPYTLAELQLAADGDVSVDIQDAGDSAAEALEASSEPEPSVENMAADERSSLRLLVPGLLVGLTLLFAAAGQIALRATPDEPQGGLRWFGASAVCLLLLLWLSRSTPQAGSRSFSWPELGAIPRRRWLYFAAGFLAFAAYRLAISPAYLTPAIPLLIWAAAGSLAYYALGRDDTQTPAEGTEQNRDDLMFTIKAGVLLFLVALLVRIVTLGQLPFVLNGTEAGIGLAAMDFLNGFRDNPFGSGWLTNPNLPFLLLAVPLRLLGSSTESLRLLSAFIGAATVPAVFVIGQRLYSRSVGLAAAILLAGSHFHIHYSRSGLTNVWDGLLILLTLGLMATAWQQDPRSSRGTWLWAGTAAGLSAYLYTSSHLLPLMLLALAVIQLLLDRTTAKKQWRNILAMALLALVIALPQLLYYQSTSGVFMERAQTLGILESQSGWLADEAMHSGSSQLDILSNQFWQAALAFNATIDSGTSYAPLVPLLSFVFGILFALGFMLAVLRLKQIRYSILVVWVTVTVIFAGVLLVTPPESRRFISAMPAVSLLAAIALYELITVFAKAMTGDRSGSALTLGSGPAYIVLLLLIPLAIALYDVSFYFGTYRDTHGYADRNTEIADRMAHYLNELDGDWTAHFYGPPSMYVSFPTLPFLAADFVEGDSLFDVPESASPAAGFETRDQVFIFLPERYGEIDQLRARYPSGSEQAFNGYYASPLFYVYEVRGSP